MWWIDQIFTIIWNISEWFRSIGQITSTWVYPFSFISTPFFAITSLFQSWLDPITNFGNWADDVWARVQQILDENGILGLILWVFPWLTDVGNWFAIRWEWFITQITDWWSVAQLTVQSWIEIAGQTLQTLIDNLTSGLAYLRATWDTFITVTLPTLANWEGVSNLIETRLRIWFPFYDDLTNILSEFKEFFADPLDWVYNKLDEFFERFW